MTGCIQMFRMEWRCRRGMLELDLLLDGWLQTGWSASGERERAAFERLLDQPDQVLFDLFFGHGTAEDPEFGALIDKIRAAAAA